MTKKANKSDAKDVEGLGPAEALAFVLEGAERVNCEDMARVVEHEDEVRAAFRRGPLRAQAKAARQLLDMVIQHHKKRAAHAPYHALAVAVFGLGYVLNPIDIIPDFLPGIGQMDDLQIFAAAAREVRRSLKRGRSTGR